VSACISARVFKSSRRFQVYGRQLLLSVDDDPINQMVVSNLLQPLGCQVLQAMNGAEALSILEKSAALPDLILLDCMMPGMSGYSVAEHIRARYGASHDRAVLGGGTRR
jgi:CheY-like chemotaxis protein